MMIPVLLAVLAGQAPAAAPQTPTAVADTTFARLPARVLKDLEQLASRTPLIALAAGGVAAAAAHPPDARSVHSLANSTAVEHALDAGSVAGDGRVQSGAAAAVYAVGLAIGSRPTQELGTALLEAQAVEGILAQGLKYAAPRHRPDGGRYSFPSGHSSAAFATADVLLRLFGWKAGIPAYAGAAYIGASRMSERRHFLSDVVFGAAIGIAASRSAAHHARAQGQAVTPRPPDVFYVPTPQPVVDAMLKMARITDKDVVYDLGCGDGRIPISAALKYGARGVGIDIDPKRIEEATENAKAAGVADKVTFRTQDLFDSDIHDATVVTLYLLPSLNEKLMPKLKKELKPGTRVISHAFDMGATWPADERGEADGKSYYLWIIR